MELTVIGKPYAKAIADMAVSDNSFDTWRQLLFTLSLIVEDATTKDFLSAPTTSSEQKISFLTSTLEAVLDLGLLGEKEKNFVALLVTNNKVFAVSGIYDVFESMDLADTKSITVNSAYALSDEQLQNITSRLSNAYGNEVTITTKVDNNLQAGIIIKDGDKIVDLSIIARADALAAQLSI